MSDNFEKNIAHQLNQFQLQPSLQVWKAVEAALDKKPTRKIPFLWWMGICVVLLGSGYWLYTSSNQPNKIEQKQELKTLEIRTETNKDAVLNNKNIISKEANTAYVKLKYNATKKVKNKHGVTTISSIENKTNSDITYQLNSHSNKTNNTQSIDSNRNPEPPLLKNDSMQFLKSKRIDQNINETNLNTIEIDSTNLKTANQVKINYTKNINRGHWFLTTGAGFTKQSVTGLQQSFAANDRLAFANAPGSGLSTVTAPAELVAANPGFHALVGIGYEKVLGKRWSIDLALQYRYIQNSQTVGQKIDSARNFIGYNTVNGSSYSAEFYYQGGNTQTINNYSHWLSLPFALYYNLHQTKNNKFQLLLGGTPTWNIAQKWLVRDENTRQFYYAPAINNKFNLSVDIGMRYIIKNDWSIAAKWSEGLTATTQLTNNKTYWNSLSFQFNKTIVFSTKKRLQK